jgi:hypothetical protein
VSSEYPGVVEIKKETARPAVDSLPTAELELENGIAIQRAEAHWVRPEAITVAVDWLARNEVDGDYSVAVHLVAEDPPTGPDDILAQADRSHPVDGWYPTSRWQAGELVSDAYLLEVLPGAQPAAIRIAMYKTLPDGTFQNTEWLSIPVPPRP